MPISARPAARAIVLAAATLCLSGHGHGAGSPPEIGPGASPDALVVTTDSDAYCRTLSQAIDAHGALPREVSDLERQGEVLCEAGRIRSGIVRLRRALLVLRDEVPRHEAGAP